MEPCAAGGGGGGTGAGGRQLYLSLEPDASSDLMSVGAFRADVTFTSEPEERSAGCW